MKGFPNGIADNNEHQALYNGRRCAVGQILPPDSGYLFSSRYLNAPWEHRGQYGPRASELLESWPEIRDTPTEPGWGTAFGEDNSALRAAFAAAGGPSEVTPGTGTQDLFNLCGWLIGEFEARGEWPGAAQAERRVSRWGRLHPQALPIAQRWRELMPPLYLRKISYGSRKAVAEEADRRFAEQFSGSDGPALRVIGVQSCGGYREDPDSFAGDCWIAVQPAPEVQLPPPPARHEYVEIEDEQEIAANPVVNAKAATRLAAHKAASRGVLKEDWLPYLRAALTYWTLIQDRALEFDNTLESFTAAEQQILFWREFERLAGRKFDLQSDGISYLEIAGL